MAKLIEEGTPEKDFNFWSKALGEQIAYMEDLIERFRTGAVDAARFFEISASALERFRYIQQQRVWIMEEINAKKK